MYTVNYHHFRSQARDFAIENNPRRVNRPWIQNAALDVFKVGFKPLMNQNFGPNTSAFNSATDEIITGRVEAASEFFQVVLDDAYTPLELKKAIDSIKRAEQSRSPMGVLPLDLRGKFLKTLSKEDRKEFLATNARFHRDWRRAAGMAIRAHRAAKK